MNTVKPKVTTIQNATREQIKNYMIDAHGWYADEIDEYTTEELKQLLAEDGQVHLFLGYAN